MEYGLDFQLLLGLTTIAIAAVLIAFGYCVYQMVLWFKDENRIVKHEDAIFGGILGSFLILGAIVCLVVGKIVWTLLLWTGIVRIPS